MVFFHHPTFLVAFFYYVSLSPLNFATREIAQPKNFEALKVLRNAPPSNILKTKSQKVKCRRHLKEALIKQLIVIHVDIKKVYARLAFIELASLLLIELCV